MVMYLMYRERYKKLKMKNRLTTKNVSCLMIFSTAAIGMLLLGSCHFSSNKVSKDVMFTAGKLKVISTGGNRKQKIMHTLYGNDQALSTSLRGDGKHTSGEKFTLVSWNEVDNKYWYGSNINGSLRSVESVIFRKDPKGKIAAEYKLVQGKRPSKLTGEFYTTEQRKEIIMGIRPAVFP